MDDNRENDVQDPAEPHRVDREVETEKQAAPQQDTSSESPGEVRTEQHTTATETETVTSQPAGVSEESGSDE